MGWYDPLLCNVRISDSRTRARLNKCTGRFYAQAALSPLSSSICFPPARSHTGFLLRFRNTNSNPRSSLSLSLWSLPKQKRICSSWEGESQVWLRVSNSGKGMIRRLHKSDTLQAGNNKLCTGVVAPSNDPQPKYYRLRQPISYTRLPISVSNRRP